MAKAKKKAKTFNGYTVDGAQDKKALEALNRSLDGRELMREALEGAIRASAKGILDSLDSSLSCTGVESDDVLLEIAAHLRRVESAIHALRWDEYATDAQYEYEAAQKRGAA